MPPPRPPRASSWGVPPSRPAELGSRHPKPHTLNFRGGNAPTRWVWEKQPLGEWASDLCFCPLSTPRSPILLSSALCVLFSYFIISCSILLSYILWSCLVSSLSNLYTVPLSLSLSSSLSLSLFLSLSPSLSLFVVVWPSPSFLSPSLKPSLSPPRISRPLSFCLSLSRLSYFGSACSGSPRPHHHHYGHVPAICPPARPARPPAEKPNVQVQSRTLTDLARILRRVDQTISRRGLNADPLVPVAAAAPPTEASSPSTPPVALSEAAALDSVSSGRQGRLTHK